MNRRINLRLVGLATVGLIGLGTFGSAAVRAEDECDEQVLLKADMERRQAAKNARELVYQLRISRSQARKLLPLLDEAAELHIAAYERQAKSLPDMVAAFGEFAREDSLNQGLSRDVERRAGRVEHSAHKARDKYTEQLIKLEKQVAELLTPAQRSLAADNGQRQHAQRRSNRHSAARRRWEEAARKDRLAAAHREIRGLYKSIHPRLGRLGERLLHPAAAELVYKAAGKQLSDVVRRAVTVSEAGTSEYPLQTCDQQKLEVQRLRTEINNWNLINGLHLSAEQIGRIVGLYEAAVPPSRSHRGLIAQVEPRVPHTMVAALERSVEGILNPGQREVVATYQACLIPPKNLKDPVRVGQAADTSFGERWLTRTRKLSGRQLTKAIDETLKHEAEHLGPLNGREERERKTLLRKAAIEAGRLSDTEFELNKAQLGQRINPRDRKEELKREIASLKRERGLPGLVAQHMLKPDFIAQLKVRGKQLADGVVTEQADLAAGPQAENCEEGCAIDGPKKSTKYAKQNKK